MVNEKKLEKRAKKLGERIDDWNRNISKMRDKLYFLSGLLAAILLSLFSNIIHDSLSQLTWYPLIVMVSTIIMLYLINRELSNGIRELENEIEEINKERTLILDKMEESAPDFDKN